MDISAILAVLSGSGLGIISGLIPGVGNFITLIILYPFLLDLDIFDILLLYISLYSISQYVGSVSATVFGIPGEASSFPAVREGHRLYLNGKGPLAISSCAIGSFFGSFVCVVLFYFISDFIPLLYHYYTTKSQAILFILLIIGLIFYSRNIWWKSLVLIIFGYLLGRVGRSNLNPNETFFTFENPDLLSGLPIYVVVTTLFVFPEIYKSFNIQFKEKSNDNFKRRRMNEHLRNWFKNWKSSIRGTTIGFFGGLVPGLSTILSSNLSYYIEKNLRNKHYSNNGDMSSLISAETANNAGAFSVLLPLLVLGIPIVPSEVILYDIASIKGYSFGFDNFHIETFKQICLYLVLINFIGIIVAWPLVNLVNTFENLKIELIYIFVGILLLLLLLYMGYINWQIFYYIWITLILFPIGWLIRNHDTMPLLFAFLLQDKIEILIQRMLSLLQ